ncbi:MAG: hypothetical protein B2I17_01910 [Thermoplasmatales archaeon B_DKE]|nr:MAG: hypothetical protein B2I17_01910 [Thermoplasmatales archaeon B_DKE]
MQVQLIRDYLAQNINKLLPVSIARDFEPRALPGKAVTIIGPRRAGKTTLMWQIISRLDRRETGLLDFEDLAFDNVDGPDCLKILTELFTEVSGKVVKNIFLDEIQKVNNWQSLVRTLLDRGYIVFASGSSSQLLSREIATQLRGRSISYLLLPFSFKEYQRAVGAGNLDRNQLADVGMIKNYLQSYMEAGGYPEPTLMTELKDKLLSEYKDLIFFKDFVERHNIKSIEVARFLFNYITQCFASEITVRKILQEMGSHGIRHGSNTVYDYFDKLQDTMIFFFVDRYSSKVSARSGWPKKVYLADNGLAWRLPLNMGRLMENLVFQQLKRKQTSEAAEEIYYYRDNENMEVDFVIKRDSAVSELIQVTYQSNSDNIKNREVDSLLKVGKQLHCENLTVLTWDVSDVKQFGAQNVKYQRLWEWLLD